MTLHVLEVESGDLNNLSLLSSCNICWDPFCVSLKAWNSELLDWLPTVIPECESQEEETQQLKIPLSFPWQINTKETGCIILRPEKEGKWPCYLSPHHTDILSFMNVTEDFLCQRDSVGYMDGLQDWRYLLSTWPPHQLSLMCVCMHTCLYVCAHLIYYHCHNSLHLTSASPIPYFYAITTLYLVLT